MINLIIINFVIAALRRSDWSVNKQEVTLLSEYISQGSRYSLFYYGLLVKLDSGESSGVGSNTCRVHNNCVIVIMDNV